MSGSASRDDVISHASSYTYIAPCGCSLTIIRSSSDDITEMKAVFNPRCDAPDRHADDFFDSFVTKGVWWNRKDDPDRDPVHRP